METASDDRISGSETMYTLYDGDWWTEETRSIFAESGSSTETVTGRTRTRLTGLGAGNLVSETMSEDIHGNETVSSRYINRISHIITEITDYSDSDTNAEQETLYGLLKSSTDKSGITTTFQYDTLERRTGVTDPRTGQSITRYNTLGQVDYSEDAATKRTEYSYDPITGRKSSVTDAENRTVYFLYDDLDRITHTWGATSPVRYGYDDYGRMDTMYTWRSGEGWDTPTWPSANDGLADITRWHYHEATGLLESKEDAQHHQTLYSYVENGKLSTRTWARTPAVTTTYSYDFNTGELTGIDYSDTTPDIGFTYYRFGQRHTVSDAVGTRTFAYNTALQPGSESITGLISRTFTRSYEPTGVIGRNTGFNTNSSYAATYGYDNTGRFNGVSWNVDSVADNVSYARVPDSHLLHTTTFDSGALVTNSYEPHRNLRTSVKNEYGATVISQYDYIYDNIGRRDSATMTGDAFSVSLPVPPDQKLINTGTYTSVGYTANDLNQYSEVNTDGTVINPTHDEDGNLTDDDRLTYVWNGENRLAEAAPKNPAVGDKKLGFLYDYMGRRVKKVTSEWDGSAWQPADTALFIYDGWNLIEELDGTGAVTASYVYGLDLSGSLQGAGGIGGILARIDHGADKAHVYFYDANGNVGQLVDAADGSVAAAYEYAPFGGLISAMGTYAAINPFRFSSKYADDVAGLYYYGYRYYSPDMGRWLSRDPIGEDGGLNLYGFVGNDGVNKLDWLGNTSIGTILDEFFSPLNFYENLWVMREGDSYTEIVKKWNVVQEHIARLRRSVVKTAYDWDKNHKTSQSWIPTKAYSPDPNAGWNELEAHPPGTDPATAKKEYIIYMTTGYATEKLHIAAIGSFRIIATADEIIPSQKSRASKPCRVKLNIWMYNEMSTRSFGRYAKHWFFKWRPMKSQFMWWNWKEIFSVGASGKTEVIHGAGTNW